VAAAKEGGATGAQLAQVFALQRKAQVIRRTSI